MLLPPFLIRFERVLCAVGAVACAAAVFVLMPRGARSQLAPAPAPPLAPRQAALRPQAVVAVAPARDAFAPRAALDDDSPPATGAASWFALRGDAGPRVTAIVTGATPNAIVESDGVPQVVGIGDHVAGSRVVAIDAATVRLENGLTLALTQPEPAP